MAVGSGNNNNRESAVALVTPAGSNALQPATEPDTSTINTKPLENGK